MPCNCPNNDYIKSVVNGVVICTRITEQLNVECPSGCTLVMDVSGNAKCNCIDYKPQIIKNTISKVEINSVNFKDVSWTVSFSPVMGSWISFYSFKPNYYINHNNYFQSGLNEPSDANEFGLWSHGLTNKSYNVFYGKKYPFTIEYPVKDDFTDKTIQSVSLFTEAVRYHNEYDYAPSIDLTFNKSVIYNNIHCSGMLNLIPEPNRIFNTKKYPKTNTDGTQDIMIINPDSDKWNYNYFYNRVKSNTANTPFIIKDENQIDLEVNNNAVSFIGKNILARINGNYFLNRLTYDKDSRFKILFKFATSKSEV